MHGLDEVLAACDVSGSYISENDMLTSLEGTGCKVLISHEIDHILEHFTIGLLVVSQSDIAQASKLLAICQ